MRYVTHSLERVNSWVLLLAVASGSAAILAARPQYPKSFCEELSPSHYPLWRYSKSRGAACSPKSRTPLANRVGRLYCHHRALRRAPGKRTKPIGDLTMNAQMKAAWRKMCGTALLWFALATVVYVATSSTSTASIVVVACLGFLSFAVGLALFADGMQRDIVARIRRGNDTVTQPYAKK